MENPYLKNIRRTLKMPLINSETNYRLTWKEDYVISSAIGTLTYAITNTQVYIAVVSSTVNSK